MAEATRVAGTVVRGQYMSLRTVQCRRRHAANGSSLSQQRTYRWGHDLLVAHVEGLGCRCHGVDGWYQDFVFWVRVGMERKALAVS